MLLIDKRFPCSQLTPDVTGNNAYNLCAATVGHRNSKTLIVSAYKAPWTTYENTTEMCDRIDNLATRFERIIVAGDFNFPSIQWNALGTIGSSPAEEGLLQLLAAHGLLQLADRPTRQSALLDLVCATHHFSYGRITNILPVASSDHDEQLFSFKMPAGSNHGKTIRTVQYDDVANILSQVNWQAAFSNCITADDFANVFMGLLYDAVGACTQQKPCCRRERLPRHIVQMLRKKKRA